MGRDPGKAAECERDVEGIEVDGRERRRNRQSGAIAYVLSGSTADTYIRAAYAAGRE